MTIEGWLPGRLTYLSWAYWFAAAKLAPPYGHVVGAAYIAKNNGRFHAAASIALHPSVFSKQKTFELFSEILHHVITLKFAVHQYINAQLLLPADGLYGGLLNGFFILLDGELPALEFSTQLTDIVRLRK